MKQFIKNGKLNEVDEAGRESFPSSDPPAWTLGSEPEQIVKTSVVEYDLSQVLIDEHQTIRIVADGLQKITKKAQINHVFDIALLQEVAEFFKYYVAQCHQPKEELLFAALKRSEERPSDYILNDLIHEHAHTQALHAELEKLLDHASEATSLYEKVMPIFAHILNLHRHHTAKEEEYVFPFIKNKLSLEERKKWMTEFKKIDETLKGRTHTDFVKLAQLIKQKTS